MRQNGDRFRPTSRRSNTSINAVDLGIDTITPELS
jgi:hypothetical protein